MSWKFVPLESALDTGNEKLYTDDEAAWILKSMRFEPDFFESIENHYAGGGMYLYRITVSLNMTVPKLARPRLSKLPRP